MYLLKEYFVPLIVTVVFHVFIVTVMLANWSVDAPKSVVKRPNFVQAKLVTLESQKKQKVKKTQQKPKIVDLTKKRKEQARKNKAAEQERKKVLQQKQAADQKRKKDLQAKEQAENLRKEAREQKEKQRQMEQRAFEQAMLEEEQALMEEAYAVEAQSFMAAIAQRIEQNWSRPPSARNGMECELKIQLVPTGRVINVDVIRGSGNSQFDRSAEQAVKKVELFPEIKQMKPEVFERYYRELTLVFKPQDLRQ